MNSKETGSHFKRILSHTSSNSGGSPTPHRQIGFPNSKKFAKLRTPLPESDHKRQNNNYKNKTDYEPLLSQELSTSPVDRHRNYKLPQRNTPEHNFTYGQRSPFDFRQDCSRGIMSVTDIELTMGDEVHAKFQSPGFTMDDYISDSSTRSKFSTQCFPLVRCSKVSCDENSCLWHRCVLKLPHHVRWEDRIVTIELEKSPEESFGFNYKSKQHIGKDEIYTLVSHVDEGSKAAKSGLVLGDLILSANNVPMQTKQKPSDINFRTQNQLRLQIQHPLEISSKAASHVEQLSTSMLKMNEIPISSMRLPQPPTPSTSPIGAGLSPSKEKDIPLIALSKLKTKDRPLYHDLPQVRIFVCGNAANEFIQCLIGDSIKAFYDHRADCLKISMKKSANGSVSISNSESFSYLFDDPSESCVNVELISVPDDRFFHHSCSWMFTRNSIFILTFDTKRLSLSSEAEMSHLCSLAHTVRTSVSGAYAHLKLYGVTPGADSISLEEVQTLFYTSHGQSLPDPKLISLAKGVMCEEMTHIRHDIFTLLTMISERQQVIYQTAIALDMVVSHGGLITTLRELTRILEEWDPDLKQMGPESLHRVVEDLINTGNLLVTNSINASCISENVKEFILPCVLFDQLSRLVHCAEKDRISMALCSCGIITRNEFLDILTVCTYDQEKVLSCMEDLRLVFPVRVMSQDSGFSDMSSVLFPYFLQDIPFSACFAESYEIYMKFEFSADVPMSSFFSLLSELSQSDSCYSFGMKALFVGHFILQGEDICLCFMKAIRQILIFRNRSGRPIRNVGKQTVLQEIQQVISRQIPSNVKVNVLLYPQEKIINVANNRKAEQTVREVTGLKREVETARGLSSTHVGASSLPHVPHPSEHITDEENSNGAEVVPDDVAGHELSQQDMVIETILDTKMHDLKYIRQQLHAICSYMSVDDVLQQFVCQCDLTSNEWELYKVVIYNQSAKLPAQAFIENYFREKNVTLRDFLQPLERLQERGHTRLDSLVRDLCTAALYGNSQLAGHFQQNSPS